MTRNSVALALATGSDDEAIREQSVATLEDHGAPDPSEIEPLSQLTADPNPLVAYWAITLIGRLSEAGKPAESSLVAALAERRPLEVRQRAAWALAKVGVISSEARDALERATASSDPRLARLAQNALGRR